MKLSEAIRMNGMMLPQGFGAYSAYDPTAPCAIGGALLMVGASLNRPYEEFFKQWPWTHKREGPCPACSKRIKEPVVAIIIWHLNDGHRWTRNQIADWVETVEPKEQPEETCFASSLEAA